MPITLRKYTMAELLAECEATLAREGRTVCEVTDWARDHQDLDIDDFEEWVKSTHLLNIPSCFALIRTCAFAEKNTPEIAAEIQRLYAGFLTTYPWADVRQPLEQFFRDNGKGDPNFFAPIDASAMQILVDLMAANHPNPKAFLMRDYIRCRIHREIDLSDLACPDYPRLKRVRVSGQL